MDLPDILGAGDRALKAGDWAGARAAYEEAAGLAPSTAAAWEGLGTACWWQDDQKTVMEARERAYRLYREADDNRSAARVATAIAFDYADYRGDLAVCSGWLQRAMSLLQDLEPSEEHVWLYLYRGFVALMFENDIPLSREHLDTALDLLRTVKSFDLQMMAVALDGMIAIREGKVTSGLRRLDEAMTAAVGGEMSDLAAIGNLCCSLIYACEAIADYDRATQWCERTREFCARLGLSTFFSICRNYYATVLIWRGEWDEADAELTAALAELTANRPGYAQESIARLGELRRRQGRVQEAEALFTQAEPHRTALYGRAALSLEGGDAPAAIELLERALRRSGEEDQAERVFLLELLVRAAIAFGDNVRARQSLKELETLAQQVGTTPLLATLSGSCGLLSAAEGDLDGARRHLEDAIDLFETCQAQFEAGCLRLDLARTLQSLGRQPAATEQAMTAQSALRRLGALHYVNKASVLLRELSLSAGSPAPREQLPGGITAREAEVLWLISAGKTNQEIASELVLSVRTVERHISTIYEKLGLHGRAARASAAALAVSVRERT